MLSSYGGLATDERARKVSDELNARPLRPLTFFLQTHHCLLVLGACTTPVPLSQPAERGIGALQRRQGAPKDKGLTAPLLYRTFIWTAVT